MKVICVSTGKGENECPIMVEEGCVYEVIRVAKKYRKSWYEFIHQLGVGYPIENFIPLSSIDETEFEREYNTQTV